MNAIAKFIKIFIQFLLIFILVSGIAGCGFIKMKSGVEPLPSIASLPLPQLPDWIEQISPTGQSEALAQIRVRFKYPLIPVEQIDSDDQKELLKKFEVLPPVAGKFRFLTPRMVGFQADEALPKATRFQVMLKAGLKDLSKHQLEQDLAWTFNTQTIEITNLPGNLQTSDSDANPIDLKPNLTFTSNVELDLNSVREHLLFLPTGSDKGVGVNVALKEEVTPSEEEQPQEKFDPSARIWDYEITPQQELKKSTRYTITFSPGLRPVRGNLASDKKWSSYVSTYGALAFDKLEFYGALDRGTAYGRFIKGSPQLKFNNGLVAESALENIKITPAPKKSIKLLQAYENEPIVNVNPWSLEPNTNYTITVGANLKDKFGQTLGKAVSLQYNTGDVAADLWAPSELNIFPADTNLQLHVSTVNLPKSQYQAAYQVLEPNDLVYIDAAYPYSYVQQLLPDAKTWDNFKAGGKKNQSYDNIVPLKEKIGASTGLLAYGIQAKTNRYVENGRENWQEPKFFGLVQLTNLGVFAQWFPESGLIRVNHLSDGSAVEGATVEIYKTRLESKSRTKQEPCAIASTDSTGTTILQGKDWKRCVANLNPPKLLAIVREGQDWAFAQTDEYSGNYGYGIYAEWDDGKPQTRGTIFSDRQLYQPGEKAWFTGVAYYLQNGELKQNKNTSYQVTLIDPNGKNTDLGTQVTNEFGTFSLELDLDKDRPLGEYAIRAERKNEVEFYGNFRVAEFKPPNFKVNLTLDKEFATLNEKVGINTESNYLFGSPVQSANVQYYVTRQKAEFIPKGWEKFAFGRQWFWPEEPPEVPSDVRQGNQVLDASGKNREVVAVADDLPYPMTYRVEALVSDVSNLSVSDVKTFNAFPSQYLIGLQNDFVAQAGQAFPIKVIVTNPSGQVVTGQRVRVELQQMDYSSVTQLQEGSATSENQVEYKTVAKEEVNSGNEPQTVSLTPSESGSYRIHANFSNSKGDRSATDTQIWVTGDEAVSWGDRYTNNRIEVHLDRETYQPGETVTALIESPYPDAELYFAVIRNKTLYSTIQKVQGGAPKIQFQVTPDMVPNAAVEAVLVRQGQPISQIEPGSVENLVRIGFVPFKTSLEDKYLQVQITPQQDKLEPGNQETVELTLKDYQGNPIQGQFTVMAVNEAILQLSGYRPPNLVETVYAEQNINTRFADNRPDVVLTPQSSPLEKGWGYGGGLSAAAANTRIRTNFQALAYYNGSVLTDTNGKANISFTLPDDLTTWRVMAVATDGNFHFGNGDATFITTKPLITNPILPQFARVGDRFLGGLSVINTTGQTGNLTVNGILTSKIKFDGENNLRTNAASGTQAYRFPMIASVVGEGKVQFFTQLNNRQSDAFEVPLEVRELDITEQAIESGVTTNQVKIPLKVDNNVLPNAGGLEISLASTLIPEITAPAKEVFERDWLPFLETSTSQLAIAANLQILSQKYDSAFNNFNIAQEATMAIENLQKLQQSDGGFSYIPSSETSNPLITPYAAESLAKAQKAGFSVNSATIDRLKTYLNKLIANPSQGDWCNDTVCRQQIRLEALMALAELGEKRADFLVSLYENRNALDRVNQLKLTRYLFQFPQWQDEAQTLFNEIQETVYETGRIAKVNLPQEWRWFNSNTTTQAETLRLFIAQKASPETIDRLLQGLLAMRREGTWQTTYDNAQALTALVEYSQLEPNLPSYNATIKLASKQLGKVRFDGYRNPNYQLQVPMEKLPRGQHDIVLNKSGKGNLHYLTAYRYRLKGNQPGRINGLRVIRYIRPANQTQVLQKIDLYATEKPLSLPPGQVFDIGLEIITDHPIDHLIVNDPLPAGLEAVDTSFQTSTSYFQAQQDSWNINYQKIHKDKVVAYGDRLDAGVYSMHYLVRSVTPGTFDWPGAEVHLQYAPEEFGRTASTTVEVLEK
ncbi:alpha-2-macroglobulin family protein [Candidatus Gracilibacteria bacterium]|nr:alpha-2-macroglobulin family protein [Candidatus Gracilibacteria bacterium]NJM88441.1 alpha-2-macroglobulin family protein [Hydrococcus sp. RU_2_2]